MDTDNIHRRILTYLIEKNQTMNITGYRDVDSAMKHFIGDMESMVRLGVTCGEGWVVEVGSGSGVMVILLGVYDPGVLLLSVDSSGRRVKFQSEFFREFAVRNIAIIQGRFERLFKPNSLGKLVARAVLPPEAMVENLGYLLRRGGEGYLCLSRLPDRDFTRGAGLEIEAVAKGGSGLIVKLRKTGEFPRRIPLKTKYLKKRFSS